MVYMGIFKNTKTGKHRFVKYSNSENINLIFDRREESHIVSVPFAVFCEAAAQYEQGNRWYEN